jgi:hypothetical protein
MRFLYLKVSIRAFHLKVEYQSIFLRRHDVLKIMSNELLVVTYRDALKSGNEKEWIKVLKDEIQRRGLKPIKNKTLNYSQ